MTRSRVLAALAVTSFVVVACSDDDTRVGPRGSSAFARYVAMGTSVSMGVKNGFNAVTAESQIGAWPSLLARQAGAANFRLPLFRPGGCLSPNVAPLSLGINLAGRPQGAPVQPDTICAGLVAGIVLPTNNVAITGHKVDDALRQTPESASVRRSECTVEPPPPAPGGVVVCRTDLPRRKILPLVLLPKQTQVTAMLAQKPTFVSVELGANDILGIVSGRAVVGPAQVVFAPNPPTITPETAFVRAYNQVIDSVKKTGAKALLMGLPSAIEKAPSLRLGSEIHVDSVVFSQAFYLTVGGDCKTTNANNYIFVPGRVFSFLNTARRARDTIPQQPRPVMNCANLPQAFGEGILSPEDIALANTTIAAYNAHIQSVATANGYAYATLDSWFEAGAASKPPFSIAQLLSVTEPYGRHFGLDGVHPTRAGQILIANAAINAINAKYKFSIPSLPTP